MNIALDRRLKRVEEKLAPPKLSEVGAMLCKLLALEAMALQLRMPRSVIG